MSRCRLNTSRRLARWLRRHGWTFGVGLAGLVFLLLVAGVFGVWGDAVGRDSWLSAASTMLAAVVAAVVALYVLGRQRRDADERHRKTKEIETAAALAAYIGTAWHIADSGPDMRDEMPDFTLPSNAVSELHRLLAVWVSYLDEGTLRIVPTGPSDVVRAVGKFGDHVRAGVGNWRDTVARQILEGSMQVNVFKDVRTCHDALQEVGRQVVMMPWWGPEDRAATLREWIDLASSLPLHLPFVGTRSDRVAGAGE